MAPSPSMMESSMVAMCNGAVVAESDGGGGGLI